MAFDGRFTPLGARVPAIMGSDIGHWDVVDFTSPLAEAYELVERELLDADTFRDFVFLELNPNGQWLWLELELGLPLVASMADLLTSRHANGGRPTEDVRGALSAS